MGLTQANSTSFKPGQIPNPNGRPKKGEAIGDLMRIYLDQPNAIQKGKTNRQVFIEKVYHKAVTSADVTAMKLIWNYSDGLPKESGNSDVVGAMLEKATFVINTAQDKKDE